MVCIDGIQGEEMKKWGWVSFGQLHEACCWKIERYILAQIEKVRDELRRNSRIDLRNFTDLNYSPNKMNPKSHIPVPFSWVVCDRDRNIHEFEMEDPDSCSFMGANAYCPAKWAKRVLEATGSGLVIVRLDLIDPEKGTVNLVGKSVHNLSTDAWNNHSYLLGI